MIRKTRGVVLHTTRYGESSLVVNCYTQESGRQAYMVKGVRKSKRNNRANLFHALSILDFEVYHKESREMQLVKEVSRAFPLNSLPFELVKSTQALFMAEVLYRVVREEESNPMLAQFLIHSIQYLDTMEGADPEFHIVFLFHLSRHLGFYPRNNYSEKQPYFDLISGQFVPFQRDPEVQMDRPESELWSRYLGTEIREIHNLGFNSTQRKGVLDSLVRYYRNQVEGMGEIRSLEVLHDLFHNL